MCSVQLGLRTPAATPVPRPLWRALAPLSSRLVLVYAPYPFSPLPPCRLIFEPCPAFHLTDM